MKNILIVLLALPIIAFSQQKVSTKIVPASSIENLLGYWFIPHNATINIQFYRNKKFVFNDYNSVQEKDEKLTGTFTLKGSVLTLLYDDRPQQKFKFYKGAAGDTNYYIKSFGSGGSYYFVKGENPD